LHLITATGRFPSCRAAKFNIATPRWFDVHGCQRTIRISALVCFDSFNDNVLTS